MNPEPVVDFFGGLRTDTRNLDHFGKAERHVLLQLFVEFDPAGADVFVDFVGQIFTDAGNISKRTVCSQRFNVVCKTFNVQCGSAVGPYSKRIRALDFQEISNLTEDERDFEIAHAEIIAIFGSPGRRMSCTFRDIRPSVIPGPRPGRTAADVYFLNSRFEQKSPWRSWALQSEDLTESHCFRAFPSHVEPHKPRAGPKP